MFRVCPGCRSKDVVHALFDADAQVLKCESCGLYYRDRAVVCLEEKCRECRNKCVNKIEDPEYWESKKQVERTRLARIRQVAGSGLNQKKVLEIGVGLGVLGAMLQKECCAYQGMEPVMAFQGIINEKFPDAGVNVKRGVYPDPSYKGCFDLIVCVDVLEFVAEPQDFLRELKTYLTPDGKIYVELPDEGCIRLRGLVRRWLNLYSGRPVHPAHNCFFSSRSLCQLFQTTGFVVVALFPVSVATDGARWAGTMKRKLPGWLGMCISVLKIIKIDLWLRQGSLVAVVGRADSTA